jgi:hypothetical protein
MHEEPSRLRAKLQCLDKIHAVYQRIAEVKNPLEARALQIQIDARVRALAAIPDSPLTQEDLADLGIELVVDAIVGHTDIETRSVVDLEKVGDRYSSTSSVRTTASPTSQPNNGAAPWPQRSPRHSPAN